MSENYIGTQNGVVVCVDQASIVYFVGRFYSFYSRDPYCFRTRKEMLDGMQDLFDRLQLPQNNINIRSYGKMKRVVFVKEEKEIVMKENELLEKKGDLATFIVRVQHRQNASWQGRITWIEKGETLHFRSIWELTKLMESAVENGYSETEPSPEWSETEQSC